MAVRVLTTVSKKMREKSMTKMALKISPGRWGKTTPKENLFICALFQGEELDIFENPYGAPTHGVPKPPSNKKRNSKNPENPDYPQK